MIYIKREECPDSLNKPAEMFVEADCKKKDVKAALLRMQHGKCCYCERPIKNLSPCEREVEHYSPQSAFKDSSGHIQWYIANKWDNLLYACAACNGAKSGKYPINRETGDIEIINPSLPDLDPEDHINFVLDEIVPKHKEKDGSNIGKSTIEKLQLENRNDLTKEFRKLRLVLDGIFVELVESIENEDVAETESLKNSLEVCMSAHKPFAAYIRCFIRERLQILNERDLPKLEQRYDRTFDRMNIYFPRGYEVRN
jgi:uncharacterized protein (TIGR02646 family)